MPYVLLLNKKIPVPLENFQMAPMFSFLMSSGYGSPGGGMWVYGLDWAGPG